MCSFITQHNATDVGSFEGACNWHADCRNVHQSCCPWIECSFLYHKPSPKAFREFGSTSNRPHNRRPRVTTPAQDLHIQHLHLQDLLRAATRTAAATIGLHNQRISAQTVRNRLREAYLHARHPHRGRDLTAVRRRNRLEWANAHIRWRLALWRGVLHGWIPVFHCTGQMADSVYGVVWVSGLLKSTLWIKWPMVAVGLWYGQAYVMDNEHRCSLLMAFWMHRDTRDEILRPIVVPFIHNHHLMLQHDNGRPHVARICTQSWNLKTSQFLHGQHTHRTCHPLSMFGMLWIGIYDIVFQFLPIFSNFAQPLKRSGPTFHRSQSTTWSTLCEGDVLHCVRQMVVTPDTDWFSDPPRTPPIQ